jgi:hypothetical protein
VSSLLLLSAVLSVNIRTEGDTHQLPQWICVFNPSIIDMRYGRFIPCAVIVYTSTYVL